MFDGSTEIGANTMQAGMRFYIFEKVEMPPEGGIYTYYKGVKFPMKGYPFPEATWLNDTLKRISMFFIMSLGHKSLAIPLLGFAILPWKRKVRILERILVSYNRLADYLIASCCLKENLYSPVCRELRHAVRFFLMDIGITQNVANSTARAVATMIEYDNAYRYRLGDMASESNQAAIMRYPIREMKYLSGLFMKREVMHPQVREKAKAFRFILTALLMHPRIRRAFRKAISAINFDKMQLDEADRYHTLLRADYDFGGLSFADRRKAYDAHHPNGSYPPEVEMKPQ